MSFSNFSCAVACLLLFFVVPAPAQNGYVVGLLPSVNLNGDLSRRYSLNFKVESRQGMLRGNFADIPTSRYQYILTDLALVGARRVGLNNRLAAGYQIRLRGGQVIHRAIQQYTLLQYLNAFRLGHRFAADQTFRSGRDLEVRLRYRTTLELPLRGTAVDSGEFYLKGNNEFLLRFQGDQQDLEWRLMPFLGYVFTDSNKLEAGLDYRLARFLEAGTSHSFWFSLSWYVKWG